MTARQLTLDGTAREAVDRDVVADRTPRGKRGALYISQDRRDCWEQAVGVAHEAGDDVHELWSRATVLALEHLADSNGQQMIITPAPGGGPLEALLNAFPGTYVEPAAEPGTCACPELHGAHHRRHPLTKRIVCWRCHPPAGAAV